MSTYYVTAMQRSVTNQGELIMSCGSSLNFQVDGRLSIYNACQVAREAVQKQCSIRGTEYLGFKIAKGNRWSCNENSAITV